MDYAAATPVRKEVGVAMQKFWSEDFGNVGAVHGEGRVAKLAVDDARERVARTLRVRANDVLFTSGGTESNNLALRGAVSSMLESGIHPADIEIISTAIEHPSISKVLNDLRRQGCVITYVPVDAEGLIQISEFTKLLSSKTRIVSIAYANSETGVVQDITRLARAVKAFEKENGLSVLFHTDASQAPLWLPCALDALGVDLMTLDAGKCAGPKGVGVLVRRAKAKLVAISFGGSQEDGLRPGTEPTSLIVGAALAIELAQNEREKSGSFAAALRNRWLPLLTSIEGVVINGSLEHRLPNNINISIPGFDSEFAVVALDAAGIAASTKSACAGAGSGRSVVVFAMTNDESRAASTIRFTLGPDTKWSDLKRVNKVLENHLEKMKDFRPE